VIIALDLCSKKPILPVNVIVISPGRVVIVVRDRRIKKRLTRNTCVLRTYSETARGRLEESRLSLLLSCARAVYYGKRSSFPFARYRFVDRAYRFTAAPFFSVLFSRQRSTLIDQ